MRIHPAVACTMLLVGGAALLFPLLVWAYLTRHASPVAEFPVPVALATMLGVLVGLVLIPVAVLFSLTPREPGSAS